MHELDLTKKTWSVHPTTPINPIPKPFNVCADNHFVVIQRIGSKSMNGRVYEASIGKQGNKFALKVFGLSETCEQEIASKLGSEYPKYFPVVISYAVCPHVIVAVERKEGNGQEEAPDSFMINEISKFRKMYALDNSDLNPREKKMLSVNLRKTHTTGDRLLDDLRTFGVGDKTINDILAYRGIRMNVMASELVSGDLLTYVETNPNSDEMPRLFGEVFEALDIMIKEGIVHGDLHLGNVLLRKYSTGEDRAIIHDFGESTSGKLVEARDHVNDISKFLLAISASVGRSYEDILVQCNILVTPFDKETPYGEAKVTTEELLWLTGKLRSMFYNLYVR